MTVQRSSWGRWQAVGLAGLLVIVVFSAGGAAGGAAAKLLGAPVIFGWLLGSVAGYLLARAQVRILLPRLLPPGS